MFVPVPDKLKGVAPFKLRVPVCEEPLAIVKIDELLLFGIEVVMDPPTVTVPDS